jgi:hypothetical protein
MIAKIINLLETNPGEFSIHQLGKELGSDPSAVAGMLETLVHLGRVEEIGTDCGFCESCTIESDCTLPYKRARKYQLSRNRS